MTVLDRHELAYRGLRALRELINEDEPPEYERCHMLYELLEKLDLPIDDDRW